MLKGIRTVYGYSTWTKVRVLDTAEQLTPEQFTTPGVGSGSIRDPLVHTAFARWLWLERWRETSRGSGGTQIGATAPVRCFIRDH
jgi:uncharacterized damage-inducible protein DinB